MSIKIYRDTAANSIFIEDANGAQFLNSLQASVVSTNVTISDLARQVEIVSEVSHSDFIDENDNPYTGTPTEICDQLNAIFTSSGTSGTELPNITSPLTISSVEGATINYELTADYGVGYEWDLSGVSGLTTVDGNARKLIGGSSIAAGTYNIPVKAINYNGEDSETIVLTVANPPYANTKSLNFNNNDYLDAADTSELTSVLGRTGNGSGSADAWGISLYFKPGTASNSNQTIVYFGAQDVANNGYMQFKFDGTSGAKRLILRYGSNNNRLELRSQNNAITVGQWHHILITYDGGTTGAASGSLSDYYSRFKLFIDGIQETTTNSHNNFGFTGAIPDDNFRVGRWNSGQNLRNNCKVDELAVFDSDVSGDITDIYNSGVPFDLSTLTTPPVNWWRCGDGDTFPTITDNINNTDLTMTNMTVADIVNDVP